MPEPTITPMRSAAFFAQRVTMRQPGILHRLDGRRHAVVDEGIHVAGFLAGHVGLDIKAFHLACDLAGEGRSIELGDQVDAASAGQDVAPAFGHRVAHGADEAQAGDDDAAPAQHLAVRPSGASPRSRSPTARW
jgi:hypothetical protein